mgnify:CR=1 FL=1
MPNTKINKIIFGLLLLYIWLPTFCNPIPCNKVDYLNSNQVGQNIQYDSLTIPQYFKRLIEDHMDSYINIDDSFISFGKLNHIDTNDSSNKLTYYSFKILHDIFTSKTAQDCSCGEVINIPYYWHWIEPNPRHDIRLTKNDSLLSKIAPPAQFFKYNSFADIDRTPFLFLSDLMSECSKYYSECDTFSTFGWCSEREMAFVALNKALGFEGKVVASGNHSWSEFVIPMITTDSNFVKMRLTVDNTFDNMRWGILSEDDYEGWKTELGSTRLERWYNKMAHSEEELTRISTFLASKDAMEFIDRKLGEYILRKE